MPRNPNISISFSTSKAAQELKQLNTELKTVRKEFEISNLSIQATGDQMALAANKIKGFMAETKILKTATTVMNKGLEDAVLTQTKLAAKVEAARQAFENAK